MADQPPIIGISGSSATSKSVLGMMEAVRKAGGVPVLFANHATRDPASDIAKVDAMIFMGNNFDIDPAAYLDRYIKENPLSQLHPKTLSERSDPAASARADYENALMQLTLDKKVPMMGVCGGLQRLNVLKGGTLLQHIPDLPGVATGHDNNEGQPMSTPVVPVLIEPGSQLSAIAQETKSLYTPGATPDRPLNEYEANSYHHQAIDKLAPGFIVSAYSDEYKHPDGSTERLIEAIEPDPKGKYAGQHIIALQWHPEFMPDNPLTQKLIEDMVEKARENAKGRDYPPLLPAIIQLENERSGLVPAPAAPADASVTLPASAPPTPAKTNAEPAPKAAAGR